MCVALSEESDETPEQIYSREAYEKLGCIFDAETSTEKKKVFQDIKKCRLRWESCNYDDFRRRRDIDNTQLTDGMKVEKGEFKCRKKDCKSNECYFYQVQTRSGDEGMTNYVVCTKCSSRFKFN